MRMAIASTLLVMAWPDTRRMPGRNRDPDIVFEEMVIRAHAPEYLPNQMHQLSFHLPQRGGKRPGAGRRRAAGRRPSVSHKPRPRFDKPAAVHVTLRVAEHVWNLRSGRAFRVIEDCLADAVGRFGLRIVQFSVMGNHLHLIVEADSSAALSRGMQGLNIRIAKALNRLMDFKGRVFADHYHGRLLTSPTELVNAIAYVLGNHRHHYGHAGLIERFSSAALTDERRTRVLAHPTTWLLRVGWRRARRDRNGSIGSDRSQYSA